MTFIPSVLTNSDLNNTTTLTNTSYTGTSTITTGYNTIYITLTSTVDSAAGGLEIQFSADNSAWTTYYTDTYFNGTLFSKSYTIVGKYWRVKYTTLSATFTINSRLSTTVEFGPQGILDSFYSNPSDSYHDAFGKLRTTTPYTIIDNKFPFAATGTTEFLSNTREDCSLTVGSGVTAVYGNSQCKITITNGSNPSSFTSQSRKYSVYQPGKSLLVLASGIIKFPTTTSTNYTARIGYFDDNNGLFFEQNQTNIGVVLRNLTVDTRIIQSEWNIDKFDGTGITGVNLNFEKGRLFVIDFEWLSVGRIRFGFYLFGRIFYCHQIINLNNLDNPYMVTANLPIRHQLTVNDTNTIAKLTQICSCVMSEGQYNPIGKAFSASNDVTGIVLPTAGTETPLIAIRGNSAASSATNNSYYHQNIVPTLINIFTAASTDSVEFIIRLYLAPNTPTVTTWTAVDVTSITQYALDGSITAITPASNGTSIIVDKGFVTGRAATVISNLAGIYSNVLQITSDVSNVSDVILLTARRVTGTNPPVYASINWEEIY